MDAKPLAYVLECKDTNNVVLPGGSPCFVASNNIVDFIVTGDFAAFTSNGPWGDTYELYANTSVYLGGKIWTCG